MKRNLATIGIVATIATIANLLSGPVTSTTANNDATQPFMGHRPVATATVAHTGHYTPPVYRPVVDFNLDTVKQELTHGIPVLVHFNWADGMDVLDDNGELNVEQNDLDTAADFVRVACTSRYKNGASENMVWNCGPFYGKWVPENGDHFVSFDEGFRRDFMVSDQSMELLFQNGAYAIR